MAVDLNVLNRGEKKEQIYCAPGKTSMIQLAEKPTWQSVADSRNRVLRLCRQQYGPSLNRETVGSNPKEG